MHPLHDNQQPDLYAEIALPLPVDRTFTYAVPKPLQERLAPGMRAIVPFQNRTETGYVVAQHAASSLPETRALIDLPDAEPVFSPALLDLCRWMAEYYCCSLGEALQCAAPRGLSVRTKKRYVLQTGSLESGRFTERQRKIIAELYRDGPLTERQLARAVGATALSNTLQALVRRGVLRAECLVAGSSVSPQTETWARLVEEGIPSAGQLEAMQRRAPKQAAVYLDLLHGEPERLTALLYEKHKVDSAVLRALTAKGLIELVEREHFRIPESAAGMTGAAKHALNPEQRAAYEAIVSALDTGMYQTFLLKGITGSGKTEVYLQAIERALALGRDAIILVPEISLTPQTVGRFKARFDTDIAVLHSGLGPGERFDEWRRAQRGEVRIVVGARSAIFAPLPRVGVVVVDEEHDASYKQNETPRYRARDVAIMRAKMSGGICVLGSATPSIESYHNAQTDKFAMLELHTRATQAKLPEVELIDMRIETKETTANTVLSRRLEEEIEKRTQTGEQVLLLLNRRGFSPFVLCPMCGWVAECQDCCVSLTYHAKGGFLLCHYCNSRREVPQVCDKCFFNPLLFLGAGTQKIEDYLMRSFPGRRIERMDADTTTGKGGHARILGRLAAGEIDILVGTQMIAKGHDYPGVTLVGVINADTGLGMPDFRAAENTFQLLTQVAGRAGRGGLPGKVLIQTYRPNHYAVQAAASHDYTAFYTREIAQREAAGYPPFRRMANLLVECEDLLGAERATAVLHRTVREQIEALGYRGVEILGPSPATVRRVQKKYRWNLGLLSKSASRLNALARAVRDAYPTKSPPPRAQLKIDLDPYSAY